MPRAEAAELAMLGLHAEAGSQDDVTGLVRLASIETLIAPIILPALTQVLAQHQGLNVEILSSAATVNLDRHDADLALRLVRPERGHLVVRQIGSLGIGLYGPAGNDMPKRFVTWPDQEAVRTLLNWSRAFGADRAPRLSVNTLAGQIEAVARGVGIAVLPHVLARREGLNLVADRLPDGARMTLPIFLAIHADLAHSRRVRTVANCLVRTMNTRRAEIAEP
ncbi:substrate-binding domain-containing protein [Devosia algicola]|uniref:Substrate-binding domain-containing protein n=1 Tax=Devosia algicola TaxID=3026418 RepID=A0ABY7YKT2_9HYPH|nr:substrate-binding domain-containing protein [Devosia algicola]WDR01768.1 substrate-binding domain-containing protein [Devosia algicola]